jgi:hypothetical protein
MKFLVVLCVGQKDDNGDKLLDINQAPFSFLKRTDIKPTAEMFKAEVVRRHKLNVWGKITNLWNDREFAPETL